MDGDRGVIFDAGSARRISESVRYEESMRSYYRPRGPSAVGSREVQIARITGSVSGGLYPAVITDWQESTSTWVDATRAIKVKPSASETLSNGSRYAVLPAGETVGGDPLYVTLPAVGNAGITVIGTDDAGNVDTYTGVTSLYFATEAGAYSGFYLVDRSGFPGTAELLCRLASASYPGLVSTGTQTFGGNKSISGSLDVSSTIAGLAYYVNGNPGVSGTLGIGATANAGIITALGSGTLGVGSGGTGLTSSATNGQLLIGNGSGFTLTTLTAGTDISITNGSGSITINSTATSVTQEQVEDWVGGMVNDTDSIQTTYNDGTGALTLDVIVSAFGSIEINAGNGLSLDGDLATPGNNKLYGTDGSGAKGWYDQPTGSYTDEEAQDAVGGILVDTDTINFTYDDGVPQIIADVRTQMSVTSDATGVKLVSDSSSPGNSKYYGTDSGGTKGYHSLPTDFLNYVSPPAYSDSSGTVNDYSYDSTYVYLCVATDTWKRWAFDSGFLPEPP